MVTAGLKWPPETCPTAYAIVRTDRPNGERDAEQADADVGEAGGEDGRPAAAEDEQEGADELGAEPVGHGGCGRHVTSVAPAERPANDPVTGRRVRYLDVENLQTAPATRTRA